MKRGAMDDPVEVVGQFTPYRIFNHLLLFFILWLFAIIQIVIFSNQSPCARGKPRPMDFPPLNLLFPPTVLGKNLSIFKVFLFKARLNKAVLFRLSLSSNPRDRFRRLSF